MAYNCIVICGTTTSGKTALGVRVAAAHNGEIISADSRQVYRGMDIGTGKDLGEYHYNSRDIPYHCIDIADPQTVYTLYNYQKEFYRAFAEITGRGALPVIVGGTGLYLEAALKGYAIPVTPEDPALRSELMALEKADLDARLLAADPAIWKRTDRSSKKRIVRSLEVAASKSASMDESAIPAITPLVLAMRWERNKLRQRIRERLLQRFEHGMVDEVRVLLDGGVTRSRLEMLGLEYRHLGRYLSNEISYETMVEELFTAICQFAKRQETWFRGMERRGMSMFWIDEARWENAETTINRELGKAVLQ